MANNIINQGGDIAVNTAGFNPVAAKQDASAQIVGTLATGAIGIADKADVLARKEEVQASAQSSLEQFNTDLDKGVTDETIAELAKNDPNFKKYADTANKLSLAQRQGLAPEMLKLRAESELKKAIARAPGLRNELRGIAQATLGFDPTGTAIKKLMYVNTTTSTDPMASILKSEQAWARGKNMPTTLNGALMTAPQLLASNEALRAAQLRVDNAETADDNSVYQIGEDISTLMAAQSNGVADSFGAMSTQIKTPEDLKLWQSEGRPEMVQYIEASTNYVNRMIDKMPTKTKKQIEAVKQARAKAMRPILGVQSLLDAKDVTEFHTNNETLNLLGASMKFDFSQQFGTYHKLQTVAPQFMKGVMPIMMTTTPAALSQIKTTLADTISNIDVEPKQLDDYLDVVGGVQSYDALDAASRVKTSQMGMKYLGAALKDYDAAVASPADVDMLARHYAVAMAGVDISSPADQRALIDMFNSPKLVNIHEKLVNADNGEIKSATIADTTVSMLGNYAGSTGIVDLQKEAGAAGMKVTYNYATQSFEATDIEIIDPNRPATATIRGARAGQQFSGISIGGGPRVLAKKATAKAVERLNSTLNTVVNNKQHDAYLSKLKPEEVRQILVSEGLVQNGVETIGSPIELTVANPAQQERDRAASFESNLLGLTRSTAQKAQAFRAAGYDEGVAEALASLDNEPEYTLEELMVVAEKRGMSDKVTKALKVKGVTVDMIYKQIAGSAQQKAQQLTLAGLDVSATTAPTGNN